MAIGANSWSVGFTPNGMGEIYLADNVKFGEGLSALLGIVSILLTYSKEDEVTELSTLKADIQDIYSNSGDSDFWEDEDFYGPDGTYWIAQN